MEDTFLAFLKTLKEDELCELVLIPLLYKMGCLEIRNTHGILERGKDIVFCISSPLEGNRLCCAIVKCIRLSGSVSDSKSIHEVLFQVRQALTIPYADPFAGENKRIDRVFVFAPFDILPSTVESVKGDLDSSGLAARVNFIDGPRLVSYIKEYTPSLLTSLPVSETRYLNSLCLRFLQTNPLGTEASEIDLDLLDTYTAGMVARINKEDAEHMSFANPDDLRQGEDPRPVFRQTPFMVILADVGAGKTTLLKRMVLTLAGYSRETGEVKPQGPIPLFVAMSHFPQSALDSFEAFTAELEAYIQEAPALANFTVDQANEYVLMLDGYDELQGFHDKAAKYISMLPALFPKGVIVTSRPSRVPDVEWPFVFYRLNPFTSNDVTEFLNKCFRKNLNKASLLNKRIMELPPLNAFCRTPLLLTLYAILASRQPVDQLPTRKAEVYKSIAEMLLGRWDSLRGVRNNYRVVEKQQMLELMASQNHAAHRRSFSKAMFLDRIRDVLAAHQTVAVTDQTAEAACNEILFRSSLIRPDGRGTFEFSHLSFQEFFCACRLQRDTEVRSKLKLILVDDWWKNVLIFYFGLTQTMDGLMIPARIRKQGGQGLRLMEYLAEAEFTRRPAKSRILRLVASDLLSSRGLPENALNACRQMGDEIVSLVTYEIMRAHSFALHSKQEKNEIGRKAGNYMAFLLGLDTPKSHSEFRAHIDLVNVVAMNDLLFLCTDLLRHIRDYTDLDSLRQMLEIMFHETKSYVGGRMDRRDQLLHWLDVFEQEFRSCPVPTSHPGTMLPVRIEELIRRTRNMLIGGQKSDKKGRR